jgi:diacylglycerol kinase family enzyme
VQFELPEQARKRGIEPVMLQPGDDLEALARDAVRRGADVLGMAGGDGSQALVASIASECDLPFVCIPAGTRNHLALDLGVDRTDVVGSLDAFVDGFERTIDLARVNGRVFVNNVSLGIYAEIVQSEAYRDAKLQTATDMLADLLGPGAPQFSFDLESATGELVQDACLVLVSNNVYVLDRLGGFGTRPRIDEGVLGVVALRVAGAADATQLVAAELGGRIRAYPGWRQWTTTELEIRSDRPVAVGLDGEAITLSAPLEFDILPNALKVRLAPTAIGQSPASVAESMRRTGVRGLFRVALRGAG